MSDKVKVRIAVAVDETGAWSSCGWGGPGTSAEDDDRMGFAVESLKDGERRYWIEATLDIPKPETVAGTVTDEPT